MYIFDLDGTLIDSNHLWADVDLKFLSRRGLTLTKEYNDFVIHSIFPIAAQFTKDYYRLPESPDEIMEEWRAEAYDFYAHTAPLKPGAKDFLLRCRQSGSELALFTASEPELCRAALARHGLEPLFHHIVFAQNLGVEKRDPQAFPLLGKFLKVPPERCVLFDDSPTACRSARDAGLTVIGVYDSFFEDEVTGLRNVCHRFISGFNQLLEEPFPPQVPGRTACW